MGTLDILVCTIDDRIGRVPSLLLPPQEGVRYVVSMQYTQPRFLEGIPPQLRQRSDVSLVTLAGRGLSRNRNHGLAHCTADAILIADDDVVYTLPRLRRLMECLDDHPDVDVALFEATRRDGRLMKPYPSHATDYRTAMAQRGYYPSSWEIVLRRRAVGRLRFDERFGIGSVFRPNASCAERAVAGEGRAATVYLACGEEEVLMHDAVRTGLCVWFFPVVIGETDQGTGAHFLSDPAVQRAKGAVFAYTRKHPLYYCLREAAGQCLRHGANPVRLVRRMWEGARVMRTVVV